MNVEKCPECDRETLGLHGEPKWCCYCGARLTGAIPVSPVSATVSNFDPKTLLTIGKQLVAVAEEIGCAEMAGSEITMTGGLILAPNGTGTIRVHGDLILSLPKRSMDGHL